MTATGALKDEHGGVKLVLRILGRICERLGAGQSVPAAHLEEMLEFLRVFVDTCHHGKEEECLFPAMEAAGVPREGGPIGQMLLEHDRGRSLVRAMAEASPGAAAGDGGAASRFVFAAGEYTGLLLSHIDKEDHVLYPMADARLSPGTQAALEAAFERIEEERVGHGRHEAFHEMMERLGREYGVLPPP